MAPQEKGPATQLLAPGFLVAMPQLADPNFKRTVVLMLRSEESGSFGVVINRPSPIEMGPFCREQDIPYAGPEDQPVMIGGPVEQDSHLLVIHGGPPLHGPKSGREIRVTDDIHVITDREGLASLGRDPSIPVRCYLGYAGWGPGQIERELAEGAWVVLPADSRLLFDEPTEGVWERALREAGIDPIALVPGGAPS
ncbi:MAG: YqgE/AlgH family protein [Acidobacteria bacterium]|nr:MAG: YqgE/AlgH family protein [Acidobacteriota bacterium]